MTKRNLCDTCLHRAVCRHGIAQQWGRMAHCWQHMDSAKSKTMYCACIQETGHVRTCGVERTYQRYRELSPLSLDAARAAELGLSYGQYKEL